MRAPSAAVALGNSKNDMIVYEMSCHPILYDNTPGGRTMPVQAAFDPSFNKRVRRIKKPQGTPSLLADVKAFTSHTANENSVGLVPLGLHPVRTGEELVQSARCSINMAVAIAMNKCSRQGKPYKRGCHFVLFART